MTFDGLILLLVFLLVVIGMVKFSAWICRTTPASAARGGTRREPSALPTPLLPPGWTVTDYAADGIRSLQVLLAQRARGSRP